MRNLYNFGYEKTKKQAVIFYFFHVFISIVLVLIAFIYSKSNLILGLGVYTLYATIATILILKNRKLFTHKMYLFFGIIAILLSMIGWFFIGFIILAYLTTRSLGSGSNELKKSNKSFKERVNKRFFIFAVSIVFVVFIIGSVFYYFNRSSVVNIVSAWKYVAEKDGNFKILTPYGNLKEVANVEFPLANSNLKYRDIIYDSGVSSNVSYLIEIYEYPSEFRLRHDSYNLDLQTDSLQQKLGKVVLISSRDEEFQGNNSRTLIFKGNNAYYKYRIFNVGDYSYGISSSSKTTNFSQFDTFANSFEILNPENKNLVFKALNSSDWDFKTLFPKDFTIENSVNNASFIQNSVTYNSYPNTRETFVISITKYYSKPDLHRLFDGMLVSVNNQLGTNYKLLSSNDSIFQNYPSINFLAQTNNTKDFGYMKGIFVLRDNTIYLIYGILDDKKYFPDIDKITKSFELN
ncbi:MAG TPA: hypothetical protein VMR41_00110 [Patescibacteria group bacterium]|nr:hypothetical protein [Patescibacteria group bacterium]